MSSHLPISGSLSEFDFATILALMHGQALDGQLKIAAARFHQDAVAARTAPSSSPSPAWPTIPWAASCCQPRRDRRSAVRKKPAPHAEEQDPPRPGAAGDGPAHARASVERDGGPSARHRLLAVHPAHRPLRHRPPARQRKENIRSNCRSPRRSSRACASSQDEEFIEAASGKTWCSTRPSPRGHLPSRSSPTKPMSFPWSATPLPWQRSCSQSELLRFDTLKVLYACSSWR